MGFNIGLVAPYPDLAQLAKEVCRELGEDVDIRQGDLSAGVAHAQDMQAAGIDVIISRGGTALAIEQAVEVPAVSIQVTGFDIIKAIHAATEFGDAMGVIGFRNVIYGTECLDSILDVSLELIYLEEETAAEAEIAAAVKRGLTIIVGDAVSSRIAAAHGVEGVLIQSGKDSIVKAIEEAKSVAAVRKRERRRAEEFKTILDFAYEGIIAVDHSGVVKVFNPMAERLLAVNAREALGRPVSEVIPGVVHDSTQESRRPKLGTVHRLGKTVLVGNRAPITVADEVVGTVFTFQDATSIQQVEKEVRRELYLRGYVAKHSFGDIVADEPCTRDVVELAKKFAATESTVLVLGETGTGKELFVQSIHNASKRRRGPFVAVNCAALPESLLESELFGYEEGAFTGSRKGGKPGLFELAHGGTIFLDEIGDMSLPIQARLLRVLEQREVMRVGADRIVPVDVRAIAATHRDLGKAVREGRFRADLYYRLNVLTIRIPSLVERRGDIPGLARRLLGAACADARLSPKTLTPDAAAELARYSWPGNVRELRNVCERLAVAVDGWQVSREEVVKLLDRNGADCDLRTERMTISLPFDGGLRGIEEYVMNAVLDATGGDQTRAAELLGISRSTLWRRLVRNKP